MNRIEFLKKVGLGAMFVPFFVACNTSNDLGSLTACAEMPGEEEGPFPYPGGEATNPLNRSNVVDGQQGIPLNLRFTVINVTDQCKVVAGARIDIWSCNKDGYYSGYDNQDGANGVQNFTGQSWLRGFQLTDTDGVATFDTIYPGWETGRATHLNFEVFVNGDLKKTSQLAFPEVTSEIVHTSTLYAAHGANPTTNNKDKIFGDSATALATETLDLTGNLNSGYKGKYVIGLAL
jgi:protocatechuate 3,4-dioxygenase beta subunit